MLERVIENWLINASERAYQVPYCQLLLNKGFSVLHISSHGPGEHGKDIIAKNSAGAPCAFQLKRGDIDTAEWRKIYSEVMELMDTAITHASVDPSIEHIPYLVTTGSIKDNVRTTIVALNEKRKARKQPELIPIGGQELLKEFIDFQSGFLPYEPKDIYDFLSLYIADGQANIDEQRFATFIQQIILINDTRSTESQRRIATSHLITKYALNQHEQKQNYISVVKGLVIACANILAKAEKEKLTNQFWESSYNLCLHEIHENLWQLKSEVLKKTDFLEGDSMGDGGTVYAYRSTLVLGWLASFELLQTILNPEYKLDNRITESIRNIWNTGFWGYWGESASPYYFAMGLFLEKAGELPLAIDIYETVLKELSENNNLKNKTNGFPDPYYTVDEILEAEVDPETSKFSNYRFAGTSYTLKIFIDCLVRLGRRDLLEKYAYNLSYIQLCEFKPKIDWHYYLWRTMDGEDIHQPLTFPLSWQKLCAQVAEKPDLKNFPKQLVNDKRFPLLFALTYPHRFTTRLAQTILNTYLISVNQ